MSASGVDQEALERRELAGEYDPHTDPEPDEEGGDDGDTDVHPDGD